MRRVSPSIAAARVWAAWAVAAASVWAVAPGAARASPAVAAADAALPPGTVVSGLGAPVSAAALAGLRGGFLSLDGRVSIAIGLRQTVSVDGVVVAATDAGARSPPPLLVFQTGTANSANLSAAGIATGVVLQNTMSNQQLQVQRVIDVSVDSLQRLQSLTLQRDVVSGLVASLRH